MLGKDDAIIWRGPLKYSVIQQFIGDVDWGELDFLIIDSPPGTGKISLMAAFASLAKNKVLCNADVDAADLYLIMDPEVGKWNDFK